MFFFKVKLGSVSSMLGSENASGYGNIIITEHQNTSVLIFKNGGKCTLKYKCHKKSGYFFCSLINSAPDLLNGIGGKDFFNYYALLHPD